MRREVPAKACGTGTEPPAKGSVRRGGRRCSATPRPTFGAGRRRGTRACTPKTGAAGSGGFCATSSARSRRWSGSTGAARSRGRIFGGWRGGRSAGAGRMESRSARSARRATSRRPRMRRRGGRTLALKPESGVVRSSTKSHGNCVRSVSWLSRVESIRRQSSNSRRMSSWVDGAMWVEAEDAIPGRSPGAERRVVFSKGPAASMRRLDDLMQKLPGRRGGGGTIRAQG